MDVHMLQLCKMIVHKDYADAQYHSYRFSVAAKHGIASYSAA